MAGLAHRVIHNPGWPTGAFAVKLDAPVRCHRTRTLKLRIRDNSIRLRLTQSEVDEVRVKGLVRGHTSFAGGNAFSYLLESSPATVKPEAHISNNELSVRVPQRDIWQWADSDEVSIASAQILDDGDELKILVEKDFACLAPRDGEDESDMFPHPRVGEQNC